jgi:hypothetical protein
MIHSKSDIKTGARIVQNDPESPTETPYKGTVMEVRDLGETSGSLSFYVIVKLDDESMRNPHTAACCPKGIMHCFPEEIDLVPEQPSVEQP